MFPLWIRVPSRLIIQHRSFMCHLCQKTFFKKKKKQGQLICIFYLSWFSQMYRVLRKLVSSFHFGGLVFAALNIRNHADRLILALWVFYVLSICIVSCALKLILFLHWIFFSSHVFHPVPGSTERPSTDSLSSGQCIGDLDGRMAFICV